jgi:hypothetical protein
MRVIERNVRELREGGISGVSRSATAILAHSRKRKLESLDLVFVPA